MSKNIEGGYSIIFDHEMVLRDQRIADGMQTPDTESNDEVAEDMRISILYEYYK